MSTFQAEVVVGDKITIMTTTEDLKAAQLVAEAMDWTNNRPDLLLREDAIAEDEEFARIQNANK